MIIFVLPILNNKLCCAQAHTTQHNTISNIQHWYLPTTISRVPRYLHGNGSEQDHICDKCFCLTKAAPPVGSAGTEQEKQQSEGWVAGGWVCGSYVIYLLVGGKLLLRWNIKWKFYQNVLHVFCYLSWCNWLSSSSAPVMNYTHFSPQDRARTSAANRLIGEVVQSRRRPLLGPSPGWKRLLVLSHLRHY